MRLPPWWRRQDLQDCLKPEPSGAALMALADSPVFMAEVFKRRLVASMLRTRDAVELAEREPWLLEPPRVTSGRELLNAEDACL